MLNLHPVFKEGNNEAQQEMVSGVILHFMNVQSLRNKEMVMTRIHKYLDASKKQDFVDGSIC